MNSEQAKQIIEACEIDRMLEDPEEVICLEQNNPELLGAYRAFLNLGKECEPDKQEKFRDYVLEQEKKGKVVIMTFDGLRETKLDDFVKQPIQGLLYDLNRDAATVLTFIDDKKWVNDYAVMQVITRLKSMVEKE